MQQKSTSRVHDNWASPVSRDLDMAGSGSWLTELRFYHVITFAEKGEIQKPSTWRATLFCFVPFFTVNNQLVAQQKHLIEESCCEK